MGKGKKAKEVKVVPFKINRNAILSEVGKRKIKWFAESVYPDNSLEQFHESYYNLLDAFCDKKIKNLMITMPPQHGKSEGSTRLLPAKILGNYPDSRIAIVSYAATFARKFNKSIQRIIESEAYQNIFPDTKLNGMEGVSSDMYVRTSEQFDIVNHKGWLKAIGRKGALTGDAVDVAILDDLYKDAAEGNSPLIREAVIETYSSVVEKRLHNDSQQLIVFTRWNEGDLIGYLEKEGNVVECGSMEEVEEAVANDPDVWIKMNYQAIKESDPTEFDPRAAGEALWKERHSLKKLLSERKKSPHVFECLNQGNPSGSAGVLYGDFKTYTELPQEKARGNYTDTADQGDDHTCSIDYQVGIDGLIRVVDVIYSQKPMEETEISVPMMMRRSGTVYSNIESNNGGRGFGRAIKTKVPEIKIRLFFQGKNKEARILTNAPAVTENILFPVDWAERFPEFYEAVTKYKRLFKANKYDDAPDVLTGIIEKEVHNNVGSLTVKTR